MAQAQSIDVIFEVREAGQSADPWQEVICIIDDGSSMSSDPTETKTRCGTFSSVGTPTYEITGNAVAESDPTVNQVTLLQAQQWQKDGTLLDFRRYNQTNGTVTEGSVINWQGSGRFTNIDETAPESDSVQFGFTFSPSGEVFIGDPIV